MSLRLACVLVGICFLAVSAVNTLRIDRLLAQLNAAVDRMDYTESDLLDAKIQPRIESNAKILAAGMYFILCSWLF